MKSITFFSKTPLPSPLRSGTLSVTEAAPDHLALSINGQEVEMNAVQIDKLRQVFHGWLHERADDPDGGKNWIEGVERFVSHVPTRGFPQVGL